MPGHSWGQAILLNTVLIAPWLFLPPTLLTRWGWLHAWLLGVLLWGTLSWRGYLVVLLYFGLGSAVTKVGYAQKAAAGIAEKRGGARGPENVWGSAAVGALCALGTLVFPDRRRLWCLGFVGSFAAKLADTVASEIGKAYGRTTVLPTTWQPVPKGTEGAVSLEGTLAGVGASLLMAWVGYGVGLISPLGVPLCVLAAIVANGLESWIGATWQTRYTWLTNEWVNVLNTLAAALLSMGLGLIGDRTLGQD